MDFKQINEEIQLIEQEWKEGRRQENWRMKQIEKT